MADELTPVAPAGGENPAPAAPAPASPQAAAPGGVTPAAPAAPQAPQAAAPDGFIPRYRYNELAQKRDADLRAAQERYNQEAQQIRAELDRYKQQVQALVGVTPQAQTEADQIKQQFFNLFPWAQKLESRFGDFETLLERANDLEASTNHYWESYGKQTMDKLFSLASDGLGAPLTEEGKRALHSSFVGFVQSSPELTARYAQDPSIVEDFWRTFSSTFIDPARRASAAGIQTRAGQVASLPTNSPSAPQVMPAPKAANLDERVAQAWAAYDQHAKR